MSGKPPDQVVREFDEAVNMTAAELKTWLASDESKEVGWTGGSEDGGRKTEPGGAESKGHESGRHIVRLLEERGEPDEDDLAEMRRVVGYVHRHLAQRPTKEDVETSRWRASLRNWGHDPLK